MTTACQGFRWIGQAFTSCDECGRPAWEHDGEMMPGGFRPWEPGEAEAIRRKWGGP